jgi:pimeloyl-ACP methyl ester carboxylesterase
MSPLDLGRLALIREALDPGIDGEVPTVLAPALEAKAFPPFGTNDVEFYIKRSAFHRVFAADVPAGEAAVMAASQRPASALSGAEPTFAAAWKTIPSWYLLGLDDRTITPSAQRFMANRADAHIMAIHSSHVAMVSHPGAVATLIERAARATS